MIKFDHESSNDDKSVEYNDKVISLDDVTESDHKAVYNDKVSLNDDMVKSNHNASDYNDMIELVMKQYSIIMKFNMTMKHHIMLT